mmetsp:Transcript_27563/g.31736  ORF Transcript_27563/g.31736 Transcript_27563/m.31736 type:complete len:203 (+) Transcript_27563:182-790(+)|eukprot:CAMPEP_0115010970 /NCGR_PEP_ID=MMETSP0216-20121206/23676_1 /TAXON_ID=223996 /ORGANISM="Protocruzia adherens, Strain Boccale" /LENGTH=202 /DNA_ID=CAMNT_0002379373 /DNA_START=184 /DNA_END=792 /DNA_ORIENTATION=+
MVESTSITASECKFEYDWSLWEHFNIPGASYADTMHIIGNFDNIEAFWQHWNNLQHSKLDNIFFTVNEGAFNMFKRDNREIRIEGLSLFKKGITPAWEDDENKKGGDLSIQMSYDVGKVSAIWQDLVLATIGGQIPCTNLINGIRVIDKAIVSNPKSHFRFEIWVNYPETQRDSHRELEEYFHNMVSGATGRKEHLKYKGHS